MKFILFTMLLCVYQVMAEPGRSPLCDTAGADGKIGGPMGASKNNIKDAFTWSSDKPTYNANEALTISVKGSGNFDGFLLYAVSSSIPDKRVGKFTVPSNAQNNADVCGPLSENPDSVLTHQAGQSYDANTSFQYTAPADASGDLTFHAIIVQKSPDGGFNYAVYESAVVVKSASGGTGKVVQNGDPQQQTPQQNTDTGPYGQPKQKGVSTVLDASQTVGSSCVPTTVTITQPPVTVTVTETPAPVTKIRKCKPKLKPTSSVEPTSTVLPTQTPLPNNIPVQTAPYSQAPVPTSTVLDISATLPTSTCTSEQKPTQVVKSPY